MHNFSDAVHLVNIGNTNEASALCHQALEQNPDDIHAAFILAKILNSKYNHERAMIFAKVVDRLSPNNPDVLSLIGKIHYDMGQLNEAVEVLRAVIKQAPNHTEAHFYLGRVLGCVQPRNEQAIMNAHNTALLFKMDPEPTAGPRSPYLGDENIILQILSKFGNVVECCVDIGAQLTNSNSWHLFEKGWRGVCLEAAKDSAAELCHALRDHDDVSVVAGYAKPGSIVGLLQSFDVPKNLGFLNLDIDSFDYDVASELLKSFRPTLFCVEINERIAPPVRFAFHYSDSSPVQFGKILFGASISMMGDLFDAHGYGIVHLEYNNLYAVPREILDSTKDRLLEISVERAWKDGFLNRADRQARCPWLWDTAYEKMYRATPPEMLAFFKNLIADHIERCTIGLE